VPRLAKAQIPWSRPPASIQPPTSEWAWCQGGLFFPFSFFLSFFFFLKQSYLFTLISCLKNVNKITQQTKAGIHPAQSQPLPST
jgi:hypothetical protein